MSETTRKVKHEVLTISASAQAVSAQGVSGAMLKAASTNSGTVYLGDSSVTTSTGFPLAAGESIALDDFDLSCLYAVGTASDKLYLLEAL